MLKRFYRAKVFRSDHKQDLDQNFIFINKLMFKVYVIHGEEHKHYIKYKYKYLEAITNKFRSGPDPSGL